MVGGGSKSSSSEPKNTRVGVNSNLGFGWLPGRSDGSTASEAGNVLLFLFSGLEDLTEDRQVSNESLPRLSNMEPVRTWNEQSRLSSTLIMAPALSNSPQ